MVGWIFTALLLWPCLIKDSISGPVRLSNSCNAQNAIWAHCLTVILIFVIYYVWCREHNWNLWLEPFGRSGECVFFCLFWKLRCISLIWSVIEFGPWAWNPLLRNGSRWEGGRKDQFKRQEKLWQCKDRSGKSRLAHGWMDGWMEENLQRRKRGVGGGLGRTQHCILSHLWDFISTVCMGE